MSKRRNILKVLGQLSILLTVKTNVKPNTIMMMLMVKVKYIQNELLIFKMLIANANC